MKIEFRGTKIVGKWALLKFIKGKRCNHRLTISIAEGDDTFCGLQVESSLLFDIYFHVDGLFNFVLCCSAALMLMEAIHFTTSQYQLQYHGGFTRIPFLRKRNHISFGYGHHPHHHFLRHSPSLSSPFIALGSKPSSYTSEDQHHSDSASVDVKRELISLTLPALASQAIDPLAQLMETAYIGRLGTVELASAGVSISIFNIISKLFNIPLLSVATSFVAEDIAKSSSAADAKTKQQLSSVSTALLLALVLGFFEALALYLGSGAFLHLIGVSTVCFHPLLYSTLCLYFIFLYEICHLLFQQQNPTYVPARHFLSLRAVGAPAVVLSLSLQGIFRGFKDTKTPVICLGKCFLSFLISPFQYLFYFLHVL